MICGHKFNFIHIMKTGGTWLSRAVDHTPQRISWKSPHVPYSELKEEEATHPTYALVRNPWDWHVSMYHFMQEKLRRTNQLSEEHKAFYRQPFDKLLTAPQTPTRYELHSHIKHMTERSDRRHQEIRWSKFEAGVLPFAIRMMEETGGQLHPQALHKISSMHKINTSEHTHYRDYYTPALRDLVGEMERDVIERFGYEF